MENRRKESNIYWHQSTVTRESRQLMNGHKSAVIWFTGLSNAGKSTIAHAVEDRLHRIGCRTYVFDGDNVRHGLCCDLGFSMEDRTENIRRIGEMTKLFVDAGVIALTAFISPFQKDREYVRQLLPYDDFLEVYCQCPLEVCESRDIKGCYRRARAGEIKEFTGISSPYEEPQNPDLLLKTDRLSVVECVELVIKLMVVKKIIPKPK